jgi:hypothetical protein
MWHGASLRKEPNPADRHISRHIKIKEHRVRCGLIDARLWGWIGGGGAGDKRRHSQSEQDAAAECFADTNQNLLNYRLGTTSIQVDPGRHRQSTHGLLRQIFGNFLEKQPSVRRSAVYGTLLASNPRLRGALSMQVAV